MWRWPHLHTLAFCWHAWSRRDLGSGRHLFALGGRAMARAFDFPDAEGGAAVVAQGG